MIEELKRRLAAITGNNPISNARRRIISEQINKLMLEEAFSEEKRQNE